MAVDAEGGTPQAPEEIKSSELDIAHTPARFVEDAQPKDEVSKVKPGQKASKKAEDYFGETPTSSFRQALANAQFLLAHAAESGYPLTVELVSDIETATDTFNKVGWTPQGAASFWPAYGKLCTELKPVTAASLKASDGETLTRALSTYRKGTFWLTALIVPISIIMFINTQLSNDISASIKETDDLALRLHDSLSAQKADAPASLNSAVPTQNDIEGSLQHFMGNVRSIYNKSIYLDAFTLMLEPKPYKDDSSRDHLQLTPKLERLNDIGYDKITVFQDVRTFSKNVQQMNDMVFGAITAYILPIMYSLLGACAYALRTLSASAVSKTFLPSSAAFARLIIALIAGLIVGLFNNFSQGVSLSPLATAFLVGYAVEVFFSFIDAFLDTLKKVRS